MSNIVSKLTKADIAKLRADVEGYEGPCVQSLLVALDEIEASRQIARDRLLAIVRSTLDKAQRPRGDGGWTLDWKLRDEEIGALAAAIADEIASEEEQR